MSTITKDQIFEIHDSLVNTFAKDPKSQELLKNTVSQQLRLKLPA